MTKSTHADATREKLVVCVRLKPLLDLEEGPLEVLRPVDEKLVVLLPKNVANLQKKDFATRSANRKKDAERRYAFDLVVGATVGNRSLYERTLAKAISDIQSGYNVTVFAYDRAKEIKTKVIPTVDVVRLHITEYRRLIAQLQAENRVLREENGELRAKMLQSSIHSVPVE
eukprot:jgi/Pico_ML_1/50680/g1847.t1